MTWLTALGVIVAALATWRIVVPRLRIDDPEAPHLPGLVTARSTAALGAVAAITSGVLWLVPPAHHWLWAPYLALGLPLVAIDLRTTFLPKRLSWAASAVMVAALVPLTVTDGRAAVAAVLGATGAFLFFYVAWRLFPVLGFGDVRLSLLTGAVSGLAGLNSWATALLAGTVAGALHGVAHALWARGDDSRPRHFPFGPALWLGPLVAAVGGVLATAG
ncbi:prepilin peptidase [Tessaracoccus massiliensis]|uniref:prepilin peptidase n=1 Tax=Tessaracoccus massiliensis TaxID=1522311 RepID=UPI000694B6DC|nr:prepilin peptidase [Tessaracoccus massiliensis]